MVLIIFSLDYYANFSWDDTLCDTVSKWLDGGKFRYILTPCYD